MRVFTHELEQIIPAGDGECPYERSGHRVLADEGNLYVLGGYNPDVVDSDVEDEEELCKRIFVQMWKFNFFYRQWRELKMVGSCPQYLASHSASLHGKTLLTFGGSGIPFGTRSSQSVYMCHLDGSTNIVQWKQLPASGQVPQCKYGQCQLYQWPYLYIVGGTTGFVYNSDIHRYDMQTGEWTCLWNSLASEEMERQSPVGRYRHEMVLHNQQLMVFGGGQARCSFPLDKIPYFDLVSGCWKVHQTTPHIYLASGNKMCYVLDNDHDQGFPSPRRCHSCVQYNNAVFLFGGREMEPRGDLWRLCLDTLQWTLLMPSSVSLVQCFFHSAAVTTSGTMYIFGGVIWPIIDEEAEEKRTHDIYRVQLTVMSLQELAWERLSGWLRSHPSPDLSGQLLHAGVPRHFIQRLSL